MSDNLLSNLNSVQREAVQHTEGPLLILSGAGSGKTRVITHRVAYLMKHHRVSPFRILAVTFTNKAANEMKERLEILVGEGTSKNLWVATFHATCARILRRDIEQLDGFTKNFTIYDKGEQVTVVKDIIRQHGLDDKMYNPRTIHDLIGKAKNNAIKPDTYANTADGYYEKIVAKIYPEYQDTLRKNNALDFDDLLNFTVELFKKHPDVLEHYQEKFEHVLVDEYQDTNRCQYELVRYLAGEKKNVCVVGDDDQSIYGFRGADIHNILDFEKNYPNTNVLRLEQNYRSTQNILEAAWSVVQNNKKRKEKKLWTKNESGELVTCYEAMDERDEAGFVGTKIEDWNAEGVDYKDFAIFYRTNAQSRIFEEALRAANIPYQIVGGLGFYDRMEIKDLIAYLRVMCNPFDSMSLRRIINVPTRGIGATSLERLMGFADNQGITLFEAVERVDEIETINAGIKGKIHRFAKIFDGFDGDDLPSDALEHVFDTTGYLENFRGQRTIEAQNRVENIEELRNAVYEYELIAEEPTLSDYLENVALIADIDTMQTDDNTDETNIVTLMTLHSAKGLEFPFVFMVGMEEGYLPHQRSECTEAGLEEERRVCYVGITRAMEQLYLVHAQARRTWSGAEYRVPSRFIEEISPHLIQHVDRYNSPFSQPEISYIEEHQEESFGVGQIVHHEKFGRGKVTKLNESVSGTYVTVRFDRAGIGSKQFDAALAQLQAV
ncbi:MAG: DNA helicase PcrA [Candidatus Poribacteria bacterium]|nr:DNA helicase PcrA [Candidatus Poribacteria bacterium]